MTRVRYGSSHRPFSPAEAVRLRRAWLAGRNLRDVAHEFPDRSVAALQRHVWAMVAAATLPARQPVHGSRPPITAPRERENDTAHDAVQLQLGHARMARALAGARFEDDDRSAGLERRGPVMGPVSSVAFMSMGGSTSALCEAHGGRYR